VSFVHLHTHSEFSLLDGANRLTDLVERALHFEMPALALTDHGCLFGAWNFQKTARKQGLKPIIGMEAYVAPGDRRDRSPPGPGQRPYYHLVLLARDMEGYRNLVKLSSIGYTEGFYHRPRVDREMLAAHSGGLIVSSACLAGEVARHLLDENVEGAREAAEWYANLFQDRYYLEVQAHGTEGQARLNGKVFTLAEELGLPMVATNDAHFLKHEDHEAHDTLLCIGLGKDKSDPNRMRYDEGLYFKGPDEMREAFPDRPDVAENTLRIAEEVDLTFEKKYHVPAFPVPDQFEDENAYLVHLTTEGARTRYGDPLPDEVRERMEFELDVILKTGYAGYFLITWDFIDWARRNGIPVGPGRGSAAGSLVSYALGITNLDPLKFDLLFERFLNPERISMPDIDIDFCYERRGEVIEYVREKYGRDAVGQIITFGTMKSRAVVRDVGRTLGFEPSETDRIAKLIPNQPGQAYTVKEAVEKLSEVKALYKQDERHRKLFDYSMTLEGLSRHASVHAAGVVIAPGPLDDYVPVSVQQTRGGGGNGGAESVVVTQYDMNCLDDAGMLKMDFLGLKTLTVIHDAVEMIRRRVGKLKNPRTGDVYGSMDDVPLDDPDVYAMLARGGTSGVFQFESNLASEKLRAMRCDRFEDLVATNALIRPGPLDSGMTDVYIRRKLGKEEARYSHPDLEPTLEPTYGVIVYQEQVMRIANQLAGFSLAEADVLRKAVGKKDAKLIRKELGRFVERSVERGVEKRTALHLAEQIETFGRYGFNRCLPGHVEVLDSRTGRMISMEELYRTRGHLRVVASLDPERLRLEHAVVADVMDNGEKPVWRLRTESGREIEATANHPFFSFDGWKVLEDLATGEHVAVPRHIPVEGRESWFEHEVVALGHLLAAGNLCHPHGVYMYSQDRAALDDFRAAAESFDNVRCSEGIRRGTGYLYTARARKQEPNGIMEWARRLGILGKTATEKEIPGAAFELNNERLGLLLARMWEGDGHIGSGDRRTAYYATSSRRLAFQVQHLLLRLSIVPRLRTVAFPYRGGTRTGYQIHVHGSENLRAFHEAVGIHFLHGEVRARLSAMILDDPQGGPSKDVVPVGVRSRIRALKAERGMTWAQVEQGSGVCSRDLFPVGTNPGKIGFTRRMVGLPGEFFGDRELNDLAESDVLWDRIVEIEYVGEMRTFDLEVPGNHNFVANDFIVHNSHSAAYSLLSYHTAWLKTHYPAEYMAALLSSVLDKTDDVVKYIAECRDLPRSLPELEDGAEVLPPDVNESRWKFTVPGDGRIRFGLGAVRGVGAGAVRSILEAREGGGPFLNLFDFLERIDLRALNKRACEALICAGALDAFGPRAQLLAGLDVAYGEVQARAAEEAAGQGSLFEAAGEDVERPLPELPDVPEWPEQDRLTREKEALGFYISGHPLDRWRDLVQAFGRVNTSILPEFAGQDVEMACVVTKVARQILRRDNSEWGRLTVEDFYGTASVLAFGEAWQQAREVLHQDAVVLLRGTVSNRERDEDDPPVFLDRAEPLEGVAASGRVAVAIRVDPGQELPSELLRKIRAVLDTHPGRAPVELHLGAANGAGNGSNPRLRSRSLRVEADREILSALREILGKGRIRLVRTGD
jgi:DNA polymerase III subunit alpha